MNKTEIFKDHSAFCARADRKINGVTAEFAALHPDYAKENADNEGCWKCSRCSDCSGCSGCSDCSRCSRCSDCSDCSGCSGCSDCSGCSGCSDCSGCSGCSDCSGCSRCSDCSRCSRCSDCSRCSRCSDCSDCSGCSGLENAKPVAQPSAAKSWFDVPIIPNIHQEILAAVEGKDAFCMGNWHYCETKHCRAGWVVHKAGPRGYALEKASSTVFAAMEIYHASCPQISVSPVRFFETDEIAMADIVRCAKEEAKLPI